MGVDKHEVRRGRCTMAESMNRGPAVHWECKYSRVAIGLGRH